MGARPSRVVRQPDNRGRSVGHHGGMAYEDDPANLLSVRYAADSDGTGRLTVKAVAHGFAGESRAWFNTDDLLRFAEDLFDLPHSRWSIVHRRVRIRESGRAGTRTDRCPTCRDQGADRCPCSFWRTPEWPKHETLPTPTGSVTSVLDFPTAPTNDCGDLPARTSTRSFVESFVKRRSVSELLA